MALEHAKPGEVIDVGPLGVAIAAMETRALVKTDDVEVVRIVLPAGKSIAPHQVPGNITVHCLEGKVDFHVGEIPREMTAGSFLYLDGGSVHSLHAKEDASLLVTILLRHKSS